MPAFLIMKNYQQIANERALLNATIRTFFESRGFVEVETPICVASPGMEPSLSPFKTTLINEKMYEYEAGLITSPEYAMKKLLGLGFEKIFTITKVFRNEESFGSLHNAEFTMLEWYEQGKDYNDCMDQTEGLVKTCANAFQQKSTDTDAWNRLRTRDVFLKYADIDLGVGTLDELRAACKRQDIHFPEDDSISDLFFRLFLLKVEPELKKMGPVFLYDYPKYQAALSVLTEDGNYGERFELYLNGLELCNGFTELTDADEQKKRFEDESEERKKLRKNVFPIDEALLALLPSITKPTCGNALGVDRLHMFVTGKKNIEDVLLFPTSTMFNENKEVN